MSIRQIDNQEQGGVGLSSLDKIAPIASIASSGLGMVGNAINQTKLMDTGSLDDVIDSYNQYRPQYTTNDQVLGDYNNFSFIDHVSKRQLMGNSPLEAVGGSILQGGQGAMAGLAGATALGAAGLSTVAPGVGTLVGAGLGLLTGGISSFAKKRKARRKARRLNRKIDDANQNAMDRMQQGMQNVNVNMGLDSLSNFYSRGGMLGQSSRPTLKETVTKNLKDKYIVQQGDSMGKISQKLGYDTDRIIRSNPDITNPSLIYPGQEIKLPQKTIQEQIDGSLYRLKEFANTLQEKIQTTMMEQDEFQKKKNLNSYTVNRGDNLAKIAEKYNTPLQELIEANKHIKDPSLIKVGDNINIPTMEELEPQEVYVPMEEQYAWEDSLDSKEAILAYTGHTSPYLIINKEDLQIHTVDPSKGITKSLPIVGVGKSGKDYNSRTYVDEKGNLIEGIGNFSSPAGPSLISGKGTYHGVPSFTRAQYNPQTGEYDTDSPSSIHWGQSPGSHACIRSPKGTLVCLDEFIKPGETMAYTLPQTDDVKFKLRDGVLVYDTPGNVEYTESSERTKQLVKQGKLQRYVDNENISEQGEKYMADHTPVYNRHISNPIKIQKIKYRKGTEEYKKNVDKYIEGLTTNKPKVQKLLNIDSRTYNELASVAMGIAEQETKFGTSSKLKGKQLLHSMNAMGTYKKAYNAITGKNIPTKNHSYGMNQIKIDGDNKELSEIYSKLGVNKKNIDDPSKSAAATMAKLAYIYKYETQKRPYKGFKEPISRIDAALYKYLGRHSEIKNKTATPSKNTYIRNVKKYMKDNQIYVPIKKRISKEEAKSRNSSLNKDYWSEQKWDFTDKIKAMMTNKYEDGGMINRNFFDEGGILENPSNTNGGVFSNGITRVESGGTHEENPNGGVMHSLDQDGTPNMVEEGEVIYKDFVFSNRLVLEEEDQMNSNLPDKFIGMTFAEIAEELQEESSERPFDPISINGLEENMMDLFISQETKKQIQEEDERFINSLIGMDEEEEMEEPMEDAYMDEMPEEDFEMMEQEEMYEDPSVGLQDLMGGI